MKPDRILIGASTIACLLALFACSGGQSSTPSSPSSASSGSPAGSAVIMGTLSGVQTNAMLRTDATGLTVTISGTGISATVAPGGSFVLNGVPSGNVNLQFSGTGVNAQATISNVADNETIHIVVSVNGSRADVTITDRETSTPGEELEGLITAIKPVARTLVVNGQTINVPTTATIQHGDKTIALNDLSVGQRVHVKATVSGSVVTATQITLQDEEPKAAEVQGKVSGLTGGCPTLTFTVQSTKVTTTASTDFKGTTCAKIANGVSVDVTGTRQTDGSITATAVSRGEGDN